MRDLKTKNRFKPKLFLVVFLCALAPVTTSIIVHFRLLPKVQSPFQKLNAKQSEILDDLTRINSSPPFPDGTRLRNAAHLFSEHVSWDGTDVNRLSSRNHQYLREIFSEYRSWKDDPELAKKLRSEKKVNAVDSSWLDYVHGFDHWDLTTRNELMSVVSRTDQLIGVGRVGLLARLPLPDFVELRHWSIVHFFKNLRKGRGLQALRTYRKIAHLMHTTGHLLGQGVAMQMLKDEEFLVETFGIQGWSTVPEEMIARYKRLTWALMGVVHASWHEPIPTEIESQLTRASGVCAGAWESLSYLSSFQDYLEPNFLFETDFSENFQRSRDFQRRILNVCGLSALEGFILKTSKNANGFLLTGARIPYARRIIGLRLISIATPKYLQFYPDTENVASTPVGKSAAHP